MLACLSEITDKALNCNTEYFFLYADIFKAYKLSQARLPLIERVNEALLKDLIDGLRAKVPAVLTGREANEILQGHRVTEDKTGLLIDMVCKKGDQASKSLCDILRMKDAEIFRELHLEQDMQNRRPIPCNPRESREIVKSHYYCCCC